MLKVGIAVGHGEGDPGAVGGGLEEHDLAGEIARSMAAHLRAHGVEIHYHSGVRDVPERIRVQAGEFNASGVDLAVQIHLNAFGDPDANGSETWVYEPGGERVEWASRMAGAMTPYFKDRGVKDKHYTFLQATKMPAVIVEAGFISNTQDRRIAEGRGEDIGKALAIATLEHRGIEIETPAESPDKDYFRVFVGNEQAGAYDVLKNALGHAKKALKNGQEVRITPKDGGE